LRTYIILHDWFLTISIIQLKTKNYYESDFIDVGDNIYSEFDSRYRLTLVIGDSEDYSRLVAIRELINYLLD